MDNENGMKMVTQKRFGSTYKSFVEKITAWYTKAVHDSTEHVGRRFKCFVEIA